MSPFIEGAIVYGVSFAAYLIGVAWTKNKIVMWICVAGAILDIWLVEWNLAMWHALGGHL